MAQGRPPLRALAHHEEHALQPAAHRLRRPGQEGLGGEQTGVLRHDRDHDLDHGILGKFYYHVQKQGIRVRSFWLILWLLISSHMVDDRWSDNKIL